MLGQLLIVGFGSAQGTNMQIAENTRGLAKGPVNKSGISSDIKSSPFLKRIQVSGIVSSSVDGMGIPGVNILIKGETTGTVTDVEGNYALNVPNDDDILVFSSIGYISQEVPVEGRTTLNVSLEEDTQNLDEVLIVGYGTHKKINLTGAVSQVTAERLEDRPVANLDQALQGVSPGLNVSTNTNLGGEPTAPMGIDIRGVGSLSGGSPWVLVDGAPMDMNSINPADVESISILKDAASTAIYGSRAAYGVILITTKSG